MRVTISRLLAATVIATFGTGFAPAPTATPDGAEVVLVDDADPDPFPFGACVTVTRLDPGPLCVVIDPDDQ